MENQMDNAVEQRAIYMSGAESLLIAESRCKRFRVSGGIYEDGAVGLTTPFFTPSEFIFELSFFRQLFDTLVTEHAMNPDKSMHITLLHNWSQQIEHLLVLDRDVRSERHACFFGRTSAFKDEWTTWKKFSEELLSTGYPSIKLTFAERVFQTLDDDNSCILAMLWSYLVMGATVMNLSGIIDKDFPAWCTETVFHVNKIYAYHLFEAFCMYVFTFDYGAKLLLAPFIRMHVVDFRTFHTNAALVNALDHVEASKYDRLIHFICMGMRLVDLMSILPFWLQSIFGELGINTSFLRFLRLAKLANVFKTARYYQLLRILLATLLRCANIVFVLLIIIGIIGLALGFVFQQFEPHHASFRTVPRSCFWVIAHLLGIKDAPFCRGHVVSTEGLVVYALLMSLKSVLWVVPLASTELYFYEETARVTNDEQMRMALQTALIHRKTAILSDKLNSHEADIGTGVQGLAPGRFHLKDPSGAILSTIIGLPLFEATPVHIPKMYVQLQTKDACARPINTILRIDWYPSPDMQLAFPRKPQGRLKLCFLESDDSTLGSDDTKGCIDVPTGSFDDTTFKVKFNEELEVDINWAAGTRHAQVEKTPEVDSLLRVRADSIDERTVLLESLLQQVSEDGVSSPDVTPLRRRDAHHLTWSLVI